MFSPHTRGCSGKIIMFEQIKHVFPAYAGMFPAAPHHLRHPSRFPRIRGDVPGNRFQVSIVAWFSPHTRGCSLPDFDDAPDDVVFPAYAGMFRWCGSRFRRGGRFPRIRGDVPFVTRSSSTIELFSPHTRGCSYEYSQWAIHRLVFPAYAGMFLKSAAIRQLNWCFPRIRGDVPFKGMHFGNKEAFSPHTRGCSLCKNCCKKSAMVFPAYAGMFREDLSNEYAHLSFPRIRGDVPHKSISATTLPKFSPHTRGCSFFGERRGACGGVFPAYAGMFLQLQKSFSDGICFPRIRGDVPLPR